MKKWAKHKVKSNIYCVNQFLQKFKFKEISSIRFYCIIPPQKNMVLFHGWCWTVSRLEPLEGDSLLFTSKLPVVPGIYSVYHSQKDERLSQPWSHPMVLNLEFLDQESSALITRPLLHKCILHQPCWTLIFGLWG